MAVTYDLWEVALLVKRYYDKASTLSGEYPLHRARMALTASLKKIGLEADLQATDDALVDDLVKESHTMIILSDGMSFRNYRGFWIVGKDDMGYIIFEPDGTPYRRDQMEN